MPHIISSSVPSGPITSLNWSIHRSRGLRDYRERTRLTFDGGWDAPQSTAFQWYSAQPSQRFQTIQYRKEKTGVQHEFILILLDSSLINRTPCCRLERVADPFHQLQAIGIHGTAAHDFIQTFESYEVEFIDKEEHNSDIVAQIEFPATFDLRDVLAVCYGISSHPQARRYTLQQSCVNRQSLSQHCSEKIRQALKSLSPVDAHPSRTKLALIIAHGASPISNGPERESLVGALISELSSDEFSHSMAKSFDSHLWQAQWALQVRSNLKLCLRRVAQNTVGLLSKCIQSSPSGPFLYSRETYAATEMFDKELWQASQESFREHQKWLEQASKERPYGSQEKRAPRNRFTKGMNSLRLWMFSPAVRMGSLIRVLCMRAAILTAHYKGRLSGKSTATHSKMMAPNIAQPIPANSLQHTKMSMAFCSLSATFSMQEGISMFDMNRMATVLGALRRSHIGALIPRLKKVLNKLAMECEELDEYSLGIVASGVLGQYAWLLEENETLLTRVWADIIVIDFRGLMAKAILEAIQDQSADAPMFKWVGPPNDVDGRNNPEPHSAQLTHQQVQEIIKERISRLSKLQVEHVPIVQYLSSPFMKLPKESQSEMEAAIEDIWVVCGPLMRGGPAGEVV